ncbi:unnamed protein product [Prorocentrum cordatum]|uniref:Uncharacterized protein n=1 Tax=Prorocentrum cordatum TaxID=2364126 RepID=A0ABN9X0A2_9DINO|nr:unnamed protein product [Polarella glacialis]
MHDRAVNLNARRGGEAGTTGAAPAMTSEIFCTENLPISFRRATTTTAPIAPLKARGLPQPAPSESARTLPGPREAAGSASAPLARSRPPNSAPTGAREALDSADGPTSRGRPPRSSGRGARALTTPILREYIGSYIGLRAHAAPNVGGA